MTNESLKTLVLAGSIPIDVVPWKEAFKKCLSGKAIPIEERLNIPVKAGDMTLYVPSIIVIVNTYFMGRLNYINTIPLNRRNLWTRDGGRCMYCGDRISTAEVTFEHVIPQSQGGELSWKNIVCSCTDCNGKKRNRTPKQAGMKLIKQPVVPRLNKKVVAKVAKKLGFEPVQEESWKGYWDVRLIN